MRAVKYFFLISMGLAAIHAKAALEALPDEELSLHTGQQNVQFSHFTGAQISANQTLFNSLIGVDANNYTAYGTDKNTNNQTVNESAYNNVHFYRIGIKMKTFLNAEMGDTDEYSNYADSVLNYYKSTSTNVNGRTLPTWDQTYDASNNASTNANMANFSCLPHEAACRGMLTSYNDKPSTGYDGEPITTQDGYTKEGYDGLDRPNLPTVKHPDYDPANYRAGNPTATPSYEKPTDYDSLSALKLENLEANDLYIEFAVKDGKLVAMRTGVDSLTADALNALNFISTGSQTAKLSEVTIVAEDGTRKTYNLSSTDTISFDGVGKQASEVLCRNLTMNGGSDLCGDLADDLEVPIKNVDGIDNDNDLNFVDDVAIPYFALASANSSSYGPDNLQGFWISNIYDTLTTLSSTDCVQCVIREVLEGFRWYDQTGIGSLGTCTGTRGTNCNNGNGYTAAQATDIDFKGSSLHIKDIPLNLVVEE